MFLKKALQTTIPYLMISTSAHAVCYDPAGTVGNIDYVNDTYVYCNGTEWVGFCDGSAASGGEAFNDTFVNPINSNANNFVSHAEIDIPYVLVGAPNQSTGGGTGGEAYLFDSSSGELLHTLSNPTPNDQDQFGYRVAIDGNIAAIAMPGNTISSGLQINGKVFIFDASTGNSISTIDHPVPNIDDSFATTLDVSGNYIIVGAVDTEDGAGGSSAGAVYVFDAITGNFLHELVDPTVRELNRHGFEIAASGNTVAIGGPGPTGDGDWGEINIYNIATGNHIIKISDPNIEFDVKDFGDNIAYDESTNLLITTADENDAYSRLYFFNSATGVLNHTIELPLNSYDNFYNPITALKLSGDNLVFGLHKLTKEGYEENDNYIIRYPFIGNAGQIYVYDKNTYDIKYKFGKPKSFTGTNVGYGNYVGIDDDLIIGGNGGAGKSSVAFEKGYLHMYDLNNMGVAGICNVTADTCLTPGEMQYNSASNSMHWCNGANIVTMNASAAGVGGCLSPSGVAGAMHFDDTINKYLFCDGAGWTNIVDEQDILGGDAVPNAYNFVDVSNASLNSFVIAPTFKISGLTAGSSFSVTGDGNPRISVDNNEFSDKGILYNDQKMVLGLDTPGTTSTILTVNIDIGGVTDTWSVTTDAAGKDLTPDNYVFPQANAAASTLTTSDTITITGINGAVPISISGDSSGEYSINGGTWQSINTQTFINNNDTLQLRVMSPPHPGSYNTAAVSLMTQIGLTEVQWNASVYGGKVLCTYYNSREILDDNIFAGDMEYSKQVHSNVRNAYHAWAIPLIGYLKKHEDTAVDRFVYFFVKSWAEEMAYRVGYTEKSNWVGKVISAIGEPLHYIAGHFIEEKKPSLFLDKNYFSNF